MNLLQARREALAAFDYHGLHGWTLKWGCALDWLGKCEWEEKAIYLNGPIIRKNEPRVFYDTLYHEMAHAALGFDGTMNDGNHGPLWQRLALDMGSRGERVANTTLVTYPKLAPALFEKGFKEILTPWAKFEKSEYRQMYGQEEKRVERRDERIGGLSGVEFGPSTLIRYLEDDLPRYPRIVWKVPLRRIGAVKFDKYPEV